MPMLAMRPAPATAPRRSTLGREEGSTMKALAAAVATILALTGYGQLGRGGR
jgi:hypothetical protein